MDFDNIFDGIKENKKTLIMVVALIVVIIIISILDLIFGINDNNKVDVEGSVKAFAEIYYEESYYPYVQSLFQQEYSNKLRQDEKEGIKLTLRKILNTFEEVNVNNFYQEGNYCDFNNTYAMIYPESPYGISDYRIEVKVSCEKTM